MEENERQLHIFNSVLADFDTRIVSTCNLMCVRYNISGRQPSFSETSFIMPRTNYILSGLNQGFNYIKKNIIYLAIRT